LIVWTLAQSRAPPTRDTRKGIKRV